MKLTLDVDCTADEARRFLGLPDVAAMQERLLETTEKRMTEALERSDPQKLVEQLMPLGMKGMEQWQALWGQVAEAAAGKKR